MISVLLKQIGNTFAHHVANKALNGGRLGPSEMVSALVESVCDAGVLKCGECSVALTCRADVLTCPQCQKTVRLPQLGKPDADKPDGKEGVR